jgi:uncharacterized protein
VPDALLHLRVIAGARGNAIERDEKGWVVRVAAPAVEGKANTALCAFLARRLDVPKSHVVLTRGASSRHKVVRVEGLTQDVIDERLRTSVRGDGCTPP